MSKKNFKGGLSSLLGETTTKSKVKPTANKIGRPQTQFKEITKSSQEGTKENETRATFCLLYTSPSPRDGLLSRMPSSA